MTRLRPFERALMKALSIHLLPKVHEDKAALNEVLANELFGLEGPRNVSSEYSQLELDLWRVFRLSQEINKSVATLQDIAFYIRSCPYTEEQVPPRRYLQFHAEAYLSEVYILRERMTTLVKIVQRQIKRLRSPIGSSEALDRILVTVEATLGPVVRTRSRHTHEQRLADPLIERLDTIDLFIRFPEGRLQRIARAQAKQAERAAFQKWRRVAAGNNRAIASLRTSYERELRSAIFFKGSPYLRAAEA